jgi:molecular chaperone GrpE (heat shock protein)
VERIETLGTQFDGELMRSIGTMTNSQYPAGYVAEQFSPAYRWGGVVVKFADVRVAAAG